MKKIFFNILFLALIVAGSSATAATVSYTYDDAGRLIRVSYPNFAMITFSYDDAGNLLGRAVEIAIPGDVSGSRRVDMADAILLLRYTAGLAELSEDQKKLANLTGHEDPDEVGIGDAIRMMSMLAGDLRKPF